MLPVDRDYLLYLQDQVVECMLVDGSENLELRTLSTAHNIITFYNAFNYPVSIILRTSKYRPIRCLRGRLQRGPQLLA